LGLPFVSIEHRLGGQLALVQFVRREDTTALLVDTRLAVREPRRQGSGDMLDALGGLGARAWAPPLPILGRGADDTVREKRGLPVVGKTRQGLVSLRFTGKGRAAPRLEGLDCAVTLLAPLLVDGALGRRLARLGIDEDPAWRDATIVRWHDVRAIALRERRHRLGGSLGQDGLGFVPGRWHAGDPRATGRGQFLPILGTIEGTVGHEIGGVGRGVELRHGVPDDVAARFALLTSATQGLHQPRDTGLVRYDSCHHPLVEVRALSPTSALGEVHHLFVRRLRAVRAPIDMKTRRIELAERARQPQTRGRRGGHEAVECRHPKIVEGIEGTPEGVSIAMARLHAWGNQTRDRLSLDKMGDEVELVVEKAETVEHQGFDRMAGSHNPHFRGLLGGSLNAFSDAEFCTHARDQTQVI